MDPLSKAQAMNDPGLMIPVVSHHNGSLRASTSVLVPQDTGNGTNENDERECERNEAGADGDGSSSTPSPLDRSTDNAAGKPHRKWHKRNGACPDLQFEHYNQPDLIFATALHAFLCLFNSDLIDTIHYQTNLYCI